jgi:hypothetical protein
MEVLFNETVILFELPVSSKELKTFEKRFPSFGDKENPAFPDELYCSPENIKLSFSFLKLLAESDQKYSYNHQKKFSDNAFDVIKKQPVEQQKILFETLALETISVINHTARPRLRIQSLPVLEKLKQEPLLENFMVEAYEMHYREAERIYKNAQSGKTGLNIFG